MAEEYDESYISNHSGYYQPQSSCARVRSRYTAGWNGRGAHSVYIMPHNRSVNYMYNRFHTDRYFDQLDKSTLNTGLACACAHLCKPNLYK